MELFEYINGHTFPSTYALRIEPYKSIWLNDKSEGKTESIKWFDYIDFIASPRLSNPFSGILDMEEKVRRVKKEVFKNAEYPLDMTLVMAVDSYLEHLRAWSSSFSLLEAAIIAAEKVRNYLISFNLEERTQSGAMVIKPKDITNVLTDIDKVMKNLNSLRVTVNSELVQEAKTRNNRQVGFYEQ